MNEATMTKAQLLALIRTGDNPALRTVCEPLKPGDDLSFLLTMRDVCQATDTGVGLAAPQIGVLKRACYIWPMRKGGESYFMLNPVIEFKGPYWTEAEEGCLSYPGATTVISRPESIRVRYFDEQWRDQVRWCIGFPARVVQHEIDHLDGICRVGGLAAASPAPERRKANG